MSVKKNLYRVDHDGDWDHVEATSMVEAIELWRKHKAQEWSQPLEEVEEPEMIAAVQIGPVIRESTSDGN